VCDSATVEKRHIGTVFGCFTERKALHVYSRLPPEDSMNYDVLKDALLKRFQLTEEGLKQKFRHAKQDKGESSRQFMTRLNTYLQRWIDMAKINQSYDSVLDIVVKEQYLDTCPRDLAVLLKERRTIDVDELARIAEQYLEAHPVRQNELRKQQTISEPTTQRAEPDTISKELRDERRTKKQCFLCRKEGYLARNCRSRQTTAALEIDEYEENTSRFLYEQNRSPRRNGQPSGRS
jgi:hypothetical protein